eukprot:3911087-Amphidinium_carterae.2
MAAHVRSGSSLVTVMVHKTRIMGGLLVELAILGFEANGLPLFLRSCAKALVAWNKGFHA